MNADHLSPLAITKSPIIMVPFSGDPLAELSSLLIRRHAKELPDLSHIIVLMPDLDAARPFRRSLLLEARNAKIDTLLGPHITTFRHWVESAVDSDLPVIGDQARELMLLEALNQHPLLIGNGSPWALIDSLIDLFDSLTQHGISLPADLDDFTRQLQHGYRLEESAFSSLSREASLVHTLWQAWHHQQKQEGVIDKHAAYLIKLGASLKSIQTGQNHFYLAGFHTLLPAEIDWLGAMIDMKSVTMVTQGEYLNKSVDGFSHPSAPLHQLFDRLGHLPSLSDRPPQPYDEMLSTIFLPLSEITTAGNVQNDDEPPPPADLDFAERARLFARTYPADPALGRLGLFEAKNAEQEAVAIDIQIRRWLLDGKQHIAIVTEDRKLARRVRALLERANVVLEDKAGWALSTTSAAAALERWLEAIEEDFDHQPLLDLLKSPFIFPELDRDELLEVVFRLERDIIYHENIARNLERYRKHIIYRANRLPWSGEEHLRTLELLDKIQSAAKPLQSLTEKRNSSPVEMLDALEESMRRMGMWQSFGADLAGNRILQELAAMRCALRQRQLKICWLEFRSWLGRTLENANFCPPTKGHVQLLTLQQSNLQNFEAVIIASAVRDYLPGQPASTPFFNDAVRHSLGLPLAREKSAIYFYHFRRLLESAPDILITLHQEKDGEIVLPSPWVELLQAFHSLAYQQPLPDNDLASMSQNPLARITNDDYELPDRTPSHPAVSVSPELIPDTFSATMYQRLIDCPYQFYVAHCLNIAAREDIREAMEKSDYGERIHKILQRFHNDKDKQSFLPPITTAVRGAAIIALENISRQVFADDLEDNLLHRGWLKRWMTIIPKYIDWQITQGEKWHISALEQSITRKLTDTLTIRGRIDRIDQCADKLAIIDYKTGIVPEAGEVVSGEAVQLPFYALLIEQAVAQVEYLKLDTERVTTASPLESAMLEELQRNTAARLTEIIQQMRDGHPMPAWGDDKTCGYCSAAGVCRKQAWENADT